MTSLKTIARAKELELKSAAVTLSDMEIFVFPELMYSLLLANLMSPRIWAWRADAWFNGLDKMTPYRRIQRLRQFIMDHYAFNLDLDTWGLTTQQRELDRFRSFVDLDTLRQSNALFGYEGDKYYFDIDIRRHFGLDKYDSDIIPYWKTETVEAMDAFRFKDGYASGAGECVSLAALYAAALFVVARIPLQDIFLLATPLHSQNFVDVEDGILTNNRRLVTKSMWFNGSAISAQARRALENEQVTVVAHETGYIHVLYPDATIDPIAYSRFDDRLSRFLTTELTDEIPGNFLRHSRDFQKCFLVRHAIHGVDHYIAADRVFGFEADSSYRLTDATRDKLLAEIDADEFQSHRSSKDIVLNDLEDYIRRHRINLNNQDDVDALRSKFDCGCLNSARAIEGLIKFCRVRPRVPDRSQKTFRTEEEPLGVTLDMERTDIVARLESIRSSNRTADLAFYAFRDLSRSEPLPFLLAAIERCPVSINGAKDLSDVQALERIRALTDESIYDSPERLAQPDEVWNYGRGDGAEKALLLANIWRARHPADPLEIMLDGDIVRVTHGDATDTFTTRKRLGTHRWEIS